MNSGSFSEQVSLIHTHSLPDHSVSNHLAPTLLAFSRYPSAPALAVSRSRLRTRHAGSSGIPGRIEFLIVRTGRSPPAAPHPASWRRSCTRFQAGERIPEEDLHLSVCACSQAHMPRPCAVEFHARGYRESCPTLSQMPRPCAVEVHARRYKSRKKGSADATALRRGGSRSPLQKS